MPHDLTLTRVKLQTPADMASAQRWATLHAARLFAFTFPSRATAPKSRSGRRGSSFMIDRRELGFGARSDLGALSGLGIVQVLRSTAVKCRIRVSAAGRKTASCPRQQPVGDAATGLSRRSDAPAVARVIEVSEHLRVLRFSPGIWPSYCQGLEIIGATRSLMVLNRELRPDCVDVCVTSICFTAPAHSTGRATRPAKIKSTPVAGAARVDQVPASHQALAAVVATRLAGVSPGLSHRDLQGLAVSWRGSPASWLRRPRHVPLGVEINARLLISPRVEEHRPRPPRYRSRRLPSPGPGTTRRSHIQNVLRGWARTSWRQRRRAECDGDLRGVRAASAVTTRHATTVSSRPQA
jgi:hypothetical protein